MDRKKIIIIVLIITAILAGIFFLIYRTTHYANKKTKVPDVKMIEGINEKVYFPQYVAADNSIYYLGNQGIKFKKYSLDTKETSELYPEDILFIKKVQFSPTGGKALILTAEYSKFIYKVLDFNAQKITPLDESIFSADWLNDDEIIYSISTENENSLNLVKASGEGREKIIDLPVGNAVIQIAPDKKKIVFYPEPEGYGQNIIYYLNLDGKKISQISQENLVGAKWSADSQKFLSEKIDENGQPVSMIVFTLPDFKTNEIPIKTVLEKTAWSDQNTVLAGIPLRKEKDDKIDLINVENKKTTIIESSFEDAYRNNLGLDLNNPMIVNQTLYFTSNDILYSLEIK